MREGEGVRDGDALLSPTQSLQNYATSDRRSCTGGCECVPSERASANDMHDNRADQRVRPTPIQTNPFISPIILESRIDGRIRGGGDAPPESSPLPCENRAEGDGDDAVAERPCCEGCAP